ncbi:helix-turn-helix transcriptional regulator [Aneurinibacillus sp. Ricciae_BoGa-3]|uniref:helix-turn-helix domain-containing protein n=1 Tax=Aneurinibacillus sp. Ricciae_BoGa-3 TaxID=3022697 RepID=UPI0023412FB7|nr:helix-turn-helix transcriptional regulator [Aneurinibacillus sp. Ricciae_BoGa-3]WCK52941.1 helix-turn-helix transcriptional regulator [Aneurinibacillus sp. Ricciae_BoGa-3]
MRNIGARFKMVRQLHHLNQKQFSQAINISQGRLSEIEKGICNPSTDTLISLAERFDVDLNWLLLERNVDLIKWTPSSRHGF